MMLCATHHKPTHQFAPGRSWLVYRGHQTKMSRGIPVDRRRVQDTEYYDLTESGKQFQQLLQQAEAKE